MNKDKKEIEIDYNEISPHVFQGRKKSELIINISDLEDIYVGKVIREFIEILDKDGRPTGLFEEFVIKEINKEKSEQMRKGFKKK